MILLRNISYETKSGKRILSDINLNIRQGEFVVVTGKSGSGKSTLGSVINGLLSHYHDGTLTGEAYINGKNIRDLGLSQIGTMVASVFQDPRSQFFMVDSFNEVAFGCGNMRLSRDEVIRRTERSLKAVGIEHLNGKSLFKLSSGEKQKVAIASCYAMAPDIYLFDEPTANLDIQSIWDLKGILAGLKEEGKTIVVLEHRLFYLPELMDRMIVLHDGKIEGEYSKEDFVNVRRNNPDIRNMYLDNLDVVNKSKPVLGDAPIFEARGLSCSHSGNNEDCILKDISITAYGKEIVGIVGENGVGKTTFAKLCAGLLKEKSGSIWMQGRKYDCKKRLGRIYFVMQDSDFQLFSDSVEAELDIGKAKERLADAKKAALLSSLEILDLKERHPMTLSRGQKQRLTVATASCADSNVIFFDEPTSGLDKNSMELVSKSILSVAAANKVVFVISHDYEFLLSVCNRIVCLKNGTIQDDFRLNDDTKTRLWSLLALG